MGDLLLRCAGQDYDHLRPLFDGRVKIAGVEMRHIDLFPPETLRRMVSGREFETSDMGLTLFLNAIERGDRSLVAIPVFPARGFRYSGIYVRNDGSVREPRDLIGKRVGEFNFYGTDTGVWIKGMLGDAYGIRHTDLRYMLGGIGKPYPPASWVPMSPPSGLDIVHAGERALDDLLESGEIDAIFSPHAPAGMRKQPATARRLFENYEEAERTWYAKTRVFPITQVFVIRRDIHEQNRWLARALYDGLKEAKKLAMDRFRPPTRGAVMPWLAAHSQRVIDLMGEDWWPYGIEANRQTLETFARYHYDQGLTRRRVAVEELFAPETRD